MTIKCSDIEFGTYDCTYAIKLPYLVKFDWETDECLREKYVSIDKCLLPEILELWKQGIKTTGNCCGHGKLNPTICVTKDNIPKMLDLKYKLVNKIGVFKAKTIVENSPDAYKECK